MWWEKQGGERAKQWGGDSRKRHEQRLFISFEKENIYHKVTLLINFKMYMQW